MRILVNYLLKRRKSFYNQGNIFLTETETIRNGLTIIDWVNKELYTMQKIDFKDSSRPIGMIPKMHNE